MIFVNPQYFFLLLLIPVFLYLGLKAINNYKSRRLKIINKVNFNKIGLKDNINEKYLSTYLWLAIILLTIFSLARPTGVEIFSETEDEGRDIVVAIDISDSMKATDATISESYSELTIRENSTNISRLSAAKKVIKGFVRNLPGDRVSLIAFSDTAFPLSALSTDYDSFYSFLSNVDSSYINEGGTDIYNALEVSEKRFFNKDNAKFIVIVSDGEEHNNKAVEKAKDLFKKNIKVISIGIGSKAGSKIYLGRDVYDQPMYKTYMGDDIITRLNDGVLKDIAKESAGRYFELGNSNISANISNFIEQTKSFSTSTKKIPQYEELYQIFVFIVILLIMAEFFIKKLI